MQLSRPFFFLFFCFTLPVVLTAQPAKGKTFFGGNFLFNDAIRLLDNSSKQENQIFSYAYVGNVGHFVNNHIAIGLESYGNFWRNRHVANGESLVTKQGTIQVGPFVSYFFPARYRDPGKAWLYIYINPQWEREKRELTLQLTETQIEHKVSGHVGIGVMYFLKPFLGFGITLDYDALAYRWQKDVWTSFRVGNGSLSWGGNISLFLSQRKDKVTTQEPGGSFLTRQASLIGISYFSNVQSTNPRFVWKLGFFAKPKLAIGTNINFGFRDVQGINFGFGPFIRRFFEVAPNIHPVLEVDSALFFEGQNQYDEGFNIKSNMAFFSGGGLHFLIENVGLEFLTGYSIVWNSLNFKIPAYRGLTLKGGMYFYFD